MRGWLQHDNGRTELSHAGPDSVIGRGPIPAFERGELVTSVDGRELRRAVRVAAATPAGSRCVVEDADDSAVPDACVVANEAAA